MKPIYMYVVLLTAVALASAAEAKTDSSTASFVRNAAIGNQFEIESSKLALDKSRNTEVRDFANIMIDDHSEAADNLEATLEESGAEKSLAAPRLDAKHQKLLNNLKRASGRNFDRQYIQAQVGAHNEAVKLFRGYSRKGSDPAIKNFATNTLPILEQHQQHIKELSSAK